MFCLHSDSSGPTLGHMARTSPFCRESRKHHVQNGPPHPSRAPSLQAPPVLPPKLPVQASSRALPGELHHTPG